MLRLCRGSFPAWLPTAVVLGVVGLSLYAYTGQARSDPAGAPSRPHGQTMLSDRKPPRSFVFPQPALTELS